MVENNLLKVEGMDQCSNKKSLLRFPWVNLGFWRLKCRSNNLVADVRGTGDLYEFGAQVDHLNGLQAVATTLVSGVLGVGWMGFFPPGCG